MEKSIKIESRAGTNILKGVGISLIFSFICLIIFAIILTYTSVSETCINPVIMVITGISILIGSFLGNSKIKKNGILNGGLVGAIYMLLLYAVSSLLNWKFGLNMQAIIMIIVGFICGMLGGVLAVNRKS